SRFGNLPPFRNPTRACAMMWRRYKNHLLAEISFGFRLLLAYNHIFKRNVYGRTDQPGDTRASITAPATLPTGAVVGRARVFAGSGRSGPLSLQSLDDGKWAAA